LYSVYSQSTKYMSDIDFVQKSEKDVWQTPDELWRPINEMQNIDLDPCAGDGTCIGDTNYTVADDGLEQSWEGVVWLNPPFSQKMQWFEKAQAELDSIETLYVVTPDSTNVQSWWHDTLAQFCSWVWFSYGRVQYVDPETNEKAGSPSFGSALHIAGRLPENVGEHLESTGDLLRRC
jgi:phage N-6-adenine-methyltransferase